ncbi:MAG: hypothetical protein WKG07_01475 [Hymenobacter sp.]
MTNPSPPYPPTPLPPIPVLRLLRFADLDLARWDACVAPAPARRPTCGRGGWPPRPAAGRR